MRVASVQSAAVLEVCFACLLACACGQHAAGLPDAGAGDAGSEPSDAGPDGGGDAGEDGGQDGGVLPLAATLVSTQFDVADDMRASREMQLSGEPFAQLLGYNLAGFVRTLSITDQYYSPDGGVDGGPLWVTDPLGYALAVESYEYSKQPMNNLSFESGAGLSLMFGPVLNPSQETGDAGFTLLLDRFQQFALDSNAGSASGNLIVSPAPFGNPLNYYGWPGFWPVFAEFSSFDPHIDPDRGAVNTCTFGGGAGAFSYGGTGPVSAAMLIANYECDYNSLNLPNRAQQVSMTLDPAGLGYATWKQGLWTINYWSTMQDTGGNAITIVAPGDLASVGQPGNAVVGFFQSGTDATGAPTYDAGLPGVYLGDIPMEGWQGLTMLEEIDNKAQFILSSMLSSDGSTLSGVPTIGAATAYAYDTEPLRYFPASIAVTETPTAPSAKSADQFFPEPTAFSVADGHSLLKSLSGVIGGFAEAFAMTDANNGQVGGSLPFLATFDGDPFPPDDGAADGESTLHDRSLGVLKIALIDLDRLHFDPASRVLVDSVAVTSGGVTRGTSVTTVELSEAILALRNAFRALNGTLQLYSNDTPDTQGVPSALDSTPLTGASYSGTLSSHLLQLIAAEADFLSTKLVASDGSVANSYDLQAQAASSTPTDLASQASAIRALLDAYLATSNESYRLQAAAVFQNLESRFWMGDVLAYRTTAGVDGPMRYTPPRFGMLHGALRQYYKLVGSRPDQAAQGALVLQRIKRTFKLVVNGWDDLNQDDHIQYPEECLTSGIEMGERALTGELGNPGDNGDRERDCVREISFVHLPAALGAELDLESSMSIENFKLCLGWLAVCLAACSTGTTHGSTVSATGGQTSGVGTGSTSAGVTGGPGGGTTGGSSTGAAAMADLGQPQVSRSIQLSADGASLWVVNADSDSISQIDVASRSLTAEVLLAAQPPSVTDGGRFDPAVRPRAIALVDSLNKAYVAGEAANAVIVVDTGTRKVLTRIPVGADPVAVGASPDGKRIYAVSHEAATVSEIDTASDTVMATLQVGEHPWGASLRADGSRLYVTQFLRSPGITVIDTGSFTVDQVTALPDQPPDPSGNKLIPNGEVRGVYAVVPRPGTGELWVPHLLLATGTPQPELDFESTDFATFTLLAPGGTALDTRLLFQSESLAGIFAGAFGPDVISGPRDIAFTPDGALALVANAQSEDVMVFDAQARVEVGLVRPTPSALIEGIVVDASGTHAYLQGRNTHNVTVLDIDETNAAGGGAVATVDGDPIECFAGADPMPAEYRHGQRLFYSSNSAQFPITKDFWMACASCHLEGQSDAVTWKFVEGPRDTPSNAGGPINTGFLFRQAVRNSVIDYDETIRIEQGGFYSRTNASQQVDLQAIADFTNYAIPFPQNPNANPDGGLTPSQANGAVIFQNNCAQCHATPGVVAGSAADFFTDSGKDNPTLDLGGQILLHNMSSYTCVTSGPFPDNASTDIDGGPRAACNFDTPTLRGIFATAPYFHDGSAATVDDAVGVMLQVAGTDLSDSDRADLVAYLMTL